MYSRLAGADKLWLQAAQQGSAARRANEMECWSNGVLGLEPITPPLQYSSPDEATKRNEAGGLFHRAG
jgi:hypothetical protein